MTLKLKRKDLWGYCDHGAPEPEKDGNPDEHKKWEKERQHAKEILYDGMTDKIMKTVKYEETPHRVLEHLKKRFIGKTYFKYAEEMTKLRELRLDPTSNISDHLGEVQRLMNRISILGKPLDEYMMPVLLIGTLPCEYDNIVETFLASHTPQDLNDPPNYEQLEHALETAYDRRQTRKTDEKDPKKETDEEKAYSARGGRGRYRGRGRGCWRGRGGRGRGYGRGRGGSGRGGSHGNGDDEDEGGRGSYGGQWNGVVQCYHCEEWGHHVFECPYLGKKPPTENEDEEMTQKWSKCCEGVHECCMKKIEGGKKRQRAEESDDDPY